METESDSEFHPLPPLQSARGVLMNRQLGTAGRNYEVWRSPADHILHHLLHDRCID